MNDVTPPKPEYIEQFFTYAHLPPTLQEVSKVFADAAKYTLTLPDNPQREVALQKLLEAKDAAVRAKLSKDWDWDPLAYKWTLRGSGVAAGPAITPHGNGA